MADERPVKDPIISRASLREVGKMLIPFAAMILDYIVHMAVPNVYPETYTPKYWAPCLLICMGIWAVVFVASLAIRPVRKKACQFSWFIAFVFVFFEVWDIATLKTGTLKLPFIPSPDKIIEQFIANWGNIVDATIASLSLLAQGLVVGLIIGFASGVLCGCSAIANYWVSPLLKIVGPVPGLIWLPIFVIAFQSSYAGSLAAIVLAVWFPMTLILSNAIKNTDIGLIERAETLGASKAHIVVHVMIPNAVPALADALFMSLSGSFGALAAAELCGVGTGLALAVRMMGTIANFGVVFAYVFAMILIFSTLTAIMFAVRNWLLRWQKGLVRW